MSQQSELTECPKCHALIPSNDEWIKCRCGYSHPQRKEVLEKKMPEVKG